VDADGQFDDPQQQQQPQRQPNVDIKSSYDCLQVALNKFDREESRPGHESMTRLVLTHPSLVHKVSVWRLLFVKTVEIVPVGQCPN
jgi:hypothetical protein